MLKKILLVLIISLVSIISPVFAADENQNEDQNKQNQTEESISQKIIKLWNRDAAPFLQGFACSFKSDVWDKTTNWLERNSTQKTNTVGSQEPNNSNANSTEEKDKKCTFFDTIHKVFTGKDNTTK